MFEELAFDPLRHDRAAFFCGVPELDDYRRRYAAQQRRKGVSAVYVLLDRAGPGQILGYYTLSAAQLDAAGLAEKDRQHLPQYPVPCCRMGRLACTVDRQGQGLGGLLFGGAVRRCLLTREQVAAYALIVDAKNDAAKAFHRHYGFRPCVDSPMTLYLPLGSQ